MLPTEMDDKRNPSHWKAETLRRGLFPTPARSLAPPTFILVFLFSYEAKGIFAYYVTLLFNFLLALYLVWSDRVFYTIIPREECGNRNQKIKTSIHIYQNN